MLPVVIALHVRIFVIIDCFKRIISCDMFCWLYCLRSKDYELITYLR